MNKTWQAKTRAQMRLKRISQNSIADRLGVTKGTVSNWFSGRHPVALEDLRSIAEMVGLSLVEMLSEDDCLARTASELDLLRKLRKVPVGQEAQAVALVSAVLATLETTPASES